MIKLYNPNQKWLIHKIPQVSQTQKHWNKIQLTLKTINPAHFWAKDHKERDETQGKIRVEMLQTRKP